MNANEYLEKQAVNIGGLAGGIAAYRSTNEGDTKKDKILKTLGGVWAGDVALKALAGGASAAAYAARKRNTKGGMAKW